MTRRLPLKLSIAPLLWLLIYAHDAVYGLPL